MRLFASFSLAACAVAGQLEGATAPESARELARRVRREQRLHEALVTDSKFYLIDKDLCEGMGKSTMRGTP